MHILGSEGSYHATRIAACAKPCAKPDSPLVQVFRAVSAGNFCLSEEERRELVIREAPLKELKGIVKCTGIEKSYFVVTGEHGVPFAGEEGRSRRLSADPVVIAVVKTGPKGVGKSTLAEMACSEEKARVGERAVLRPMGIDP